METGERLGPFDVSLIPIGAYSPRWFMKTMHVNPEEAVQIHQDVNSAFSLAIHWGTFPLTAEEPGDPPERLKEALRQAELSEEVFLAVPLGSTTPIPPRAKEIRLSQQARPFAPSETTSNTHHSYTFHLGRSQTSVPRARLKSQQGNRNHWCNTRMDNFPP